MGAPPLRVRAVSSALGCPPTLVFDRAAVREVDRLAVEAFGMPGIALMENAAAALARACFERLDARARPTVLLLCGPGNNGGDGFACARRLSNAGVRPVVALFGEPRDADSDAGVNLRILRAIRAPAIDIVTVGDDPGATLDALTQQFGRPALLVDALLGTGLDRPLEGALRGAVRWLNAQQAPVVAADIPTGLDADSGEALGGEAVRVACTVTFAGLKRGFLAPRARAYLGEVLVADIGVPAEALTRLGAPPPAGAVEFVSA